MSSLSLKITNLMAMKNITSEAALARFIDIPQPTLYRLLAGKTNKPNQKIIKKIADFFNVSVADLIVDDSILEDVYIPETERYHRSAGAVLRYLMQDIGNISEGELFRRTGVPQPTIHRILSGMTPNPRMESIEPLAEFFNISTDQMLGRVPLPKDRIPGSFTAIATTKKVVPLLNWREIVNWPEITKKSDFKVDREWITSESGITGSAFALKIMNTDYFPEFRKNTVIILDCSREPKNGDFVLGLLTKNNESILGRLVIEQHHEIAILIHLSQSDRVFHVAKEAKLCGVIVEAKHSF